MENKKMMVEEKKNKERTKEKNKEDEGEKRGIILKSQGRVGQWKKKK